jgi:hypothetical protein
MIIKLLKNIKVGKISFLIFLIMFQISSGKTEEKANTLYGNFIEIKILDKISSKNDVLKIKIGDEIKFKNISIKSMKCKNSEFDDNPEITAYLQIKDLTNTDNNEVFIFNGWTFSSSPTLTPFDHPVYDIWLTKCY